MDNSKEIERLESESMALHFKLHDISDRMSFSSHPLLDDMYDEAEIKMKEIDKKIEELKSK
jgi:predicted translin family RNA/ssDNA-binding protein